MTMARSTKKRRRADARAKYARPGNKTRDGDKPKVIKIKRHVVGPPRRAPGQVLLMTPTQIKAQGLQEGVDFECNS